MFFKGFGCPGGAPRCPWDPLRATLMSLNAPGVPGPSKMDLGAPLELTKMEQNQWRVALKTAFSHGASLKNCNRKIAIFAYSIFCKIVKIELSPTRELNFGSFQNCIGRLFWVRKNCKIAVLRAWEPYFGNVQALTSRTWFFYDFAINLIFPMFFQGFGCPGGAPRCRWGPLRVTLVSLNAPGAPRPSKMDPGGTPRAHQNRRKSVKTRTENSVFAWSIPQKLQSRKCNFCILDFLQSSENWALAYTKAQFWLVWKLHLSTF